MSNQHPKHRVESETSYGSDDWELCELIDAEALALLTAISYANYTSPRTRVLGRDGNLLWFVTANGGCYIVSQSAQAPR